MEALLIPVGIAVVIVVCVIWMFASSAGDAWDENKALRNAWIDLGKKEAAKGCSKANMPRGGPAKDAYLSGWEWYVQSEALAAAITKAEQKPPVTVHRLKADVH